MAFKFFKKKETDFPTEEKAEILDIGEPPMGPNLQEYSDFNKGFRSPEELRPPTSNRGIPPAPEDIGLPPFSAPEPLPMPVPKPMQPMMPPMPSVPEEHEFESDFGPIPTIKGTPHIYIRVNKYKEVMEAIQNLSGQIDETKNDLEEIHSISESEREKIKESATVLLEIEKLLSYLEKTFSAPED